MTQALSLDERFFLRCVNCQLYLGRNRGPGFPRNLGLYVRSDLLAVHSNGVLFAFSDEDSRTLFICRIISGDRFTEVGRIRDFDPRIFCGLEWDEARDALLGLLACDKPAANRVRYETVWFPEAALVA